mmetsp:Transcript_20729/g.43283  ORF Transcript_20729/g.43283 Transcript_20729/m.43283 type:complete len:218 (-) Transcript_20729:239-892(-)
MQISAMIKIIKNKLTGNQRKPQRPIDVDDGPQSPTISEDTFSRSVVSPQLSARTGDRPVPAPPPVRTETSRPNNQEVPKTQSNSRYFMKIFVPDKLEPGKIVEVHVPGGTKLQTCIPPRSEWSFQNCNGESRPFFLSRVEPAAGVLNSLVPIPSMKASQLTYIPKKEQIYAPKAGKKVPLSKTANTNVISSAPSSSDESDQQKSNPKQDTLHSGKKI